MLAIAQQVSRRLIDGLHHLLGHFADAPVAPIAPLEASGLRAICHTRWPDDQPRLLAAWEALCGEVPGATAFHAPVWQRAVAASRVRADQLRLVVVWEADRLVAVLPLHARVEGGWETIAPGVTDYLDPLVHPACEADAWRIMLTLLAKAARGRPLDLTLHNVRDDAPCRRALAALAGPAGFALDERSHESCPRVALPQTWDALLAGLDAHVRKEVRRKVNKAMTRGGGRVIRCGRAPAEIAASLSAAFGLMEQASGAKGADVRRTLRPILERAAPALIADGRLWLTTLLVKDRPAACTLQFAHPGGPQLYNCGFDQDAREWSPGVVLTAHLFRAAIESAAPAFDLLRGQEAYKYDWGAVDRPLWTLRLTSRA